LTCNLVIMFMTVKRATWHGRRKPRSNL